MDRATFEILDRSNSSDPADETVVNGAPYDATSTLNGASALVDQPSDGLSDEIKRRQVALAVHYVSIARSVIR